MLLVSWFPRRDRLFSLSLSSSALYPTHVPGDLDYVMARMTHARTHDGQWSTRFQPLSLPILISSATRRRAVHRYDYLPSSFLPLPVHVCYPVCLEDTPLYSRF